jgi:hypothetical protein
MSQKSSVGARICSKWVLRLAQHRIIAQNGPEIQQHLLNVEDMRRTFLETWGDTVTMPSKLCRRNSRTNTRRHHVTVEGDIYKMPATSKY